MSKMLILMRHAKAQRPVEGQPDFERELTEAGKRSLAATLPHLLKFMPTDAPVRIWSSPAERAMQTACIMQRCCKDYGINVASDIEPVEALWNQNAAAFMEAVRACESDIVLAVGHNPFIEDLTAQLAASRIDFATGGFAAIALADEDVAVDGSPAGRLLWFAQGPVSQRWKTLVQLERTLKDGADEVIQRLDAFFENPEDIETAHKLRVSIRTLRSLVAFVSPWQKRAQNKALQADLKSIVGCTSRLRELDVFSEQAEELEGAAPEFIAFCRNKAAEERRGVLETLASKQVTKRFERVQKQIDHVEWRDALCAEGLDAKEVRARFDGLATQLEGDLAALDLADAEATHDVRKRAKQVRYDAENFERLLGDDAVGIAKGMTAHQDNLGAICDARVNIGIVDSLSGEDVSEPVAWDLALLRAQNETFLYKILRDSR